MAVPKTRQIKIGDTFGHLTVIGERCLIQGGQHRVAAFPCRCDCPSRTEKIVRGQDLLKRNTASCGCCQHTGVRHGGVREGLSKERIYNTWRDMISRCQNPRAKFYPSYGGRGITVCPEWQDFLTFRAWALANGYAADLMIDRRDNDQGYTPANCQWATSRTQARNTRKVVVLAAFGERKSLPEWAEDSRCAVSLNCLRSRIKAGWDAEAAMLSPAAPGRRRG